MLTQPLTIRHGCFARAAYRTLLRSIPAGAPAGRKEKEAGRPPNDPVRLSLMVTRTFPVFVP